MFCFIRDKAPSHVHALPNELANLRNSGNRDTGKETSKDHVEVVPVVTPRSVAIGY
jgi:hypothetical protein